MAAQTELPYYGTVNQKVVIGGKRILHIGLCLLVKQWWESVGHLDGYHARVCGILASLIVVVEHLWRRCVLRPVASAHAHYFSGPCSRQDTV